jgi:2-polyprenyl-6-methoxyphenol hydroxylase-like FAD-dependent oxidoreductase
MERRQVVIVGAGPVGLLTALGLARQGIEVTVFDSEPQVVRSPRAAAYFSTTLEVLEKLGLLADAHAIGYRSYQFKMWWPEFGETMETDLRHVDEGGKETEYILHFGQHILAELVMEHLARLPRTEVLWNHAVKALGQADGKARVAVDGPDGEVVYEADWVIGTDGARSTVRSLLGLPFEGMTWPERFVATNIEYPFEDFGYAPSNMVADPVNWAVVARLGKENLWRVTYGEDADLDEATILERLPARFAEILPDPSIPYRLDNFSPYRLHQRSAPTYRVDHVLLAGDAAHATNPCGGLGLTGGVLDADILSDALGAVIKGEAGEGVLDFYAEERRRVFLEVTSPLASNFKRMLSESDPEKRQQDKALMMSQSQSGKKDQEMRSSSLADSMRGRPLSQRMAG